MPKPNKTISGQPISNTPTLTSSASVSEGTESGHTTINIEESDFLDIPDAQFIHCNFDPR